MKKYYYLLFFTLLITYSCTLEGEKGQKTNQAEQDSLHIASLVDKARAAYFHSPDSMKNIADELLFFSKKKKHKRGLASAYNILATYEYLASNYPAAIKYYQQALLVHQKIDNPKGKASIYNNMGNTYLALGNLDLALAVYFKSLVIEEKAKHLAGIAASHMNIALIYGRIGEKEKALEHSQKGYLIANENNLEREKMQGSLQLAKDLDILGKYDSALIYVDTCIACAQRLNIEMGVYRAKEMKASIYADRINTKEFRFSDAENKRNKKYALKIHKDIQNYYQKMKLASPMLNNSLTQLIILRELGEYEEAEKMTLETLKLAFQLGDKGSISKLYHELAYVQRALGKLDSSYLNLERHYVYKDSIIGLEKDKEIKNIAAKYETEKKAAQIAKLSEEKEQRTIMFSGVIIGFILLVLVLIFFFRQKRLQSQYLALDSEQKFLRTQMNPHFIFNALTAIQFYVLKNEAQKSVFYISTFAKLMRQVLNNSQDNFVSLEEEIDTLKNYLELQKVRFQDKFDYQVELDPELEIDELAIPPMFAQPFIENSLEHGIKHKEEKGNIKIKFYQKDKKYLVFEVEDDGIGLDKSQVINTQNEKKHQSMATKITKSRIELLNKRFNLDVKFDISPIKNEKNDAQIGTKVWFLLPFKYI